MLSLMTFLLLLPSQRQFLPPPMTLLLLRTTSPSSLSPSLSNYNQQPLPPPSPSSPSRDHPAFNSPPAPSSPAVPRPPLVVQPLRRTSRAGAHKPSGFYKKLASGKTFAQYTACHLRAAECSRLYGAELTRHAGETEVVNMIRDRKAARPQDWRKLSKRAIREALPSFMFYKAKDETPEPLPDLHPRPSATPDHTWTTVVSKEYKHKSPRKIRLRGRWVGGGHRQQKCPILKERVAPTARSTSHSLLLAIASKEGRKLHVGDIPSAYLQADHKPANGRPVHIIADRHTTSLIVHTLPEYQHCVMPNGKMILRVDKAMYGLVESAWLWYRELEQHLTSIGYTVSSSDRALFYKKTFLDGQCIASNIASVHVDDIASAASPNAAGTLLEQEFWDSMERKWPGIKRQSGLHYRHLSWNIYQDPHTMHISNSQRDYLLEIVKTSGVERTHRLPCRSSLLISDPLSPPLPDTGIRTYRSTLQKVAYAREGRPDIDFTVCWDLR